MKLGVAHEVGLALAATFAILIVLVDGELPAFAWIALAAPWISAGAILAKRSIPAMSSTLLAVASLAFGGAAVFAGGLESSVLAGAETLLGLLCARLIVRRTAGHDLQAALLAVLLVLAGSVLNSGLSYLVLFVAFSITIVWSLTTRQLLAGADDGAAARERKDIVTPAFFAATGVVSVAVLVSAAIVFTAFPRVGFGDIGAFLQKESKLPGSVALRGDPRLAGGNGVVARVRGVPYAAFDTGLYLRGAVYDQLTYDGFSQSRQDAPDWWRGGRTIALVDPVEARYEITLMPIVGDTLLTLGGVAAIRGLGGGTSNPNFPLGISGRNVHDELKSAAALITPMRYQIIGSISRPAFATPQDDPRDDRELPPNVDDNHRWYQLPADLAETARDISSRVVGETGSASARATALRNFLLSEFRYSQDPPRFSSSPLKTFLTTDRQGHCEYFAAAYALLLRSQGIAARVVGGFQGGAWDDGLVIFQERHAHAWVEWYLPGYGWVVDDATPLANAPREQLSGFAGLYDRVRRFWDDRVIDYSIQDQTAALAELRKSVDGDGLVRAAAAAAAVGLVIAVITVLRRRRALRAEREREHPLAKAIVEAVARATNKPVARSTTVREAVARVQTTTQADAPLVTALKDALSLYEMERFGGEAVPTSRLKAAVRALKR